MFNTSGQLSLPWWPAGMRGTADSCSSYGVAWLVATSVAPRCPCSARCDRLNLTVLLDRNHTVADWSMACPPGP
jgi:hypothetical protein